MPQNVIPEYTGESNKAGTGKTFTSKFCESAASALDEGSIPGSQNRCREIATGLIIFCFNCIFIFEAYDFTVFLLFLQFF